MTPFAFFWCAVSGVLGCFIEGQGGVVQRRLIDHATRPGPARVASRSSSRIALAALTIVALLSLMLTMQTPPVAAALAVRIAATPNFGGNYDSAQWVPITVALANDGAGASGEIIAEIPGASPPLRFSQRIELPTRSQKVVTLYTQIPSRVGTVSVHFDAGNERVDAPPMTLRELKSGQGLVGVIVDDAVLGAEITRAVVGSYGSSTFEAITITPDEIPSNTFGLGSFSALIVGDASTGRWSAEQRAAVADWVARGGQLVAAGGPNWRKTLEGLGELPPLRPTDSRTVAGLTGLAASGSANGPTGQAVVATGDLLAGATRLADQDGAPLVAARNWGRGTVTSLAFDPGTSALGGWSGAGSFWQRLALDTPHPVGLQEPFDGSSGASNQIASVLRDIPGLALPPTWLLGLILLAFIIAIGPVNYLILRAVDRRELAWVTIPLVTILFAGTIYLVGATTKGRSIVLNTASVVRISPGVRSAEVVAFYGLFTPTRGIRDVALSGESLVQPFSRRGLGDNDELGSDVRFEQGTGSAVRGASFAQWTQRTIAAQGRIDPVPVAAKVELRWDGQKVVGTVTNTSSAAIEDMLLLHNNAYQSVGSLAPGASVTIDWRPTATQTTGYNRGLGTVYYFNGNQSQSNQPGQMGVNGRRAAVLDALSGGVLDYRSRTYNSGVPTPTPTATATPRPGTPRPATSTATRRTPTPTTPSNTSTATNKPVQVLFWRSDVPIDLKVSAGERYMTTLVIQESYPGATTQSVPAPVAAAERER